MTTTCRSEATIFARATLERLARTTDADLQESVAWLDMLYQRTPAEVAVRAAIVAELHRRGLPARAS